MPRRVLYFDTETHQAKEKGTTKHRMLIAWTCYVEYDAKGCSEFQSWNFWDSPFFMWQYIEGLVKSNHGLYVMAHNIFFDLQCSDFFHYFTKWGWELDFYYEKGMTYLLTIRRKKRLLRCLSTTNFYDGGAKELGIIVGLPKIEVDFKSVSPEDLKSYCRRDTEIVVKAMEFYYEFIRDNDLGQFCNTKSSQAMYAFRHRFMTNNIYVHEDKEIRQLERRAYHGGRCECFQIGKIAGGPFVTLDINSMYPYIMKYTGVPTKLQRVIENPKQKELEWMLDDFCIVAEIDVHTDEPIYPVYNESKLIFPVGKFTTFVCSEGLQSAIRLGHFRNCAKAAIYRKEIFFNDYVDFFYGLKVQFTKDNNEILRELTKKFLNSLYGKFAQKRAVVHESRNVTFDGYYRIECYNAINGELGVEYKMFNKHVFEFGTVDTENSFIAIAAHITETARFYLWEIMKEIGLEKIIYCDTDGVKIRKKDQPAAQHLIEKHTLGALKIENEFEELNVYGAKAYITEKERRLKGIPHKAKEIKPGVFEYQTFLKQASHMQKQITRYYMVRDTVKTLKYEYNKGEVLPNGKVIPLLLWYE